MLSGARVPSARGIGESWARRGERVRLSELSCSCSIEASADDDTAGIVGNAGGSDGLGGGERDR